MAPHPNEQRSMYADPEILEEFVLTSYLLSFHEFRLGQPNCMNYQDQFSQKNLWLRVEINEEFAGEYGDEGYFK